MNIIPEVTNSNFNFINLNSKPKKSLYSYSVPTAPTAVKLKPECKQTFSR